MSRQDVVERVRFGVSALTGSIFAYLPKGGEQNVADVKVDRTGAVLLTAYVYCKQMGTTLDEAVEPFLEFLTEEPS